MGSSRKKVRSIVRIDEEKCDGCGLCVPACAEGAIKVIDGKARLVNERHCDGLGACIGECPRGAITIEEREAEPFESPKTTCPSAQEQAFDRADTDVEREVLAPESTSGCPAGTRGVGAELRNELRHWPVQLALVNPRAPFFRNAKLLVVADCVPFVCPDFHHRFLRDRSVVVGCPKLDDVEDYIRRLTELLENNDVPEIVVAHMEVPCCFGMRHIIESALKDSERKVPVRVVTMTVKGEILEGS